MADENDDGDLVVQLNNLKLENQNLKGENENLKVQCNEAEVKLENFSDSNIFEVDPVKNVILRYKQQIQDLKKMKIKTAPPNTNMVQLQSIQEHNKQLLKMNETFAEENREKSAQIVELKEANQTLKTENDDLKKAKEGPNDGMFASTSTTSYIQSPSDDYGVLSPASSSSQNDASFLKFSHDTVVNTGVMPPQDHTQAFLYECQTAKAKVTEMEDVISRLEKENQHLQSMLNERINPANYQTSDEVNKVKTFNETLQEYLQQERQNVSRLQNQNESLQVKIRDLEANANADVFQEQIKAFQEDFDTERLEKVNVLRQKSDLQSENQSLKTEINRLKQQFDDAYRRQGRTQGGYLPYNDYPPPHPSPPTPSNNVPYQRTASGGMHPSHPPTYNYDNTDPRYSRQTPPYNNGPPPGHRGPNS